MADLVKRQHFVPRTYLKHFGFAKGDEVYINVLPRLEKTSDKIFDSNIKNIALKRHLYTLPGETIEQKMAIEKFYSDELERHYDRIYSILVNPEKNEITPEERELIISTVVTMFYRTTRWISMHNGLMDRVFESMFQLCAQTGKDYFMFEGHKMSIKGKTLKQFTEEHNKEQQPIMVMTQLEVAMKLIAIRIKNDGIMVSKLGEDDAEFITSDNPVTAANPMTDRIMPFDPKNILRLPLDSKHMLILMPYGEEETLNRIVRNEVKGSVCNMEKLTSNFQQMEMAERFLFGSKKSLEGYLSTKEESERPLTKEEQEKFKGINELIQKGRDLGLL